MDLTPILLFNLFTPQDVKLFLHITELRMMRVRKLHQASSLVMTLNALLPLEQLIPMKPSVH